MVILLQVDGKTPNLPYEEDENFRILAGSKHPVIIPNFEGPVISYDGNTKMEIKVIKSDIK